MKRLSTLIAAAAAIFMVAFAAPASARGGVSIDLFLPLPGACAYDCGYYAPPPPPRYEGCYDSWGYEVPCYYRPPVVVVPSRPYYRDDWRYRDYRRDDWRYRNDWRYRDYRHDDWRWHNHGGYRNGYHWGR